MSTTERSGIDRNDVENKRAKVTENQGCGREKEMDQIQSSWLSQPEEELLREQAILCVADAAIAASSW